MNVPRKFSVGLNNLTRCIAVYVSEIGAVVKVVDSHLCGLGSIPGANCSFFIVFLGKVLSLYFMCSD